MVYHARPAWNVHSCCSGCGLDSLVVSTKKESSQREQFVNRDGQSNDEPFEGSHDTDKI
jgi:hypothetical protein